MKGLATIVLAISLAAINAFSYEAVGEINLRKLFTCTVRQMIANAPSLYIAVNENKEQVAVVETALTVQHLSLLPSTGRVVIDGTIFDGNGIVVDEYNGVENPPARAVATLTEMGLTYNCSPIKFHPL